jgi:hypothetical protein
MQGNPKMESVGNSKSNVQQIGYDPTERTLYVRFRSGAEYRYREVPADVYAKLREASSAGKFLYQQISGVYPMSK